MSFKIALPVCLIVCLPLLSTAQSAPQPVSRTSWGAPDLGPEDRGLGERRLLGFNSGPPVMPSAYNNYNNYLQVFQTPDYVVILTEIVHEARVVPLDGRAYLSRSIPQWLGDGRGRWEGDTLVIETENFRADRGFSMGGRSVGPSERMHLTERLTRAEEAAAGH